VKRSFIAFPVLIIVVDDLNSCILFSRFKVQLLASRMSFVTGFCVFH